MQRTKKTARKGSKTAKSISKPAPRDVPVTLGGYENGLPFDVHEAGMIPWTGPVHAAGVAYLWEGQAIALADEALFRGYVISVLCQPDRVAEAVATIARQLTREVCVGYEANGMRLVFWDRDPCDPRDDPTKVRN